jgi:uncharacterized protein YbdZ (MbtH family)
MDIQKQIAFEKSQAKDINCDYEELKQRLDHCEKLSGHRYLPTSPRHEAWLVWDAAWEESKAQAVPEGFVLVPKELSDEYCFEHANQKFENCKNFFEREHRDLDPEQFQRLKDHWIQIHVNKLKTLHGEMIEAQEQKG